MPEVTVKKTIVATMHLAKSDYVGMNTVAEIQEYEEDNDDIVELVEFIQEAEINVTVEVTENG